jgi:hypothetical protein
LAELRVPPGCTGLQMEGGGRYDATRTGRVSVDNPAHVRQIKKASEASGEPIREALFAATPGGPSRVCPVCAFVGYGWQENCPKGHGEMPFGDPRRRAQEAGAL